MASQSLFDQISEMRVKFQGLYGHQKKLRALQNRCDVVPFQHNGYLILIKNLLRDGFLDHETARFLDHMVSKYFESEDYLNWAHKTRWLKGRMEDLRKQQEKPRLVQTDMFEMAKKRFSTPNIPVEILSKTQAPMRRAV